MRRCRCAPSHFPEPGTRWRRRRRGAKGRGGDGPRSSRARRTEARGVLGTGLRRHTAISAGADVGERVWPSECEFALRHRPSMSGDAPDSCTNRRERGEAGSARGGRRRWVRRSGDDAGGVGRRGAQARATLGIGERALGRGDALGKDVAHAPHDQVGERVDDGATIGVVDVGRELEGIGEDTVAGLENHRADLAGHTLAERPVGDGRRVGLGAGERGAGRQYLRLGVRGEK